MAREFIISANTADQRLDKFVMRYLNAAPKAFVHKMLRKKNITVNGKRAEGSLLVSAGDVVTFFLSDSTIENFIAKKPSVAGALDIIYEDANIILLNKPTNLLTQPDTKNGDSLVSRLRHYAGGTEFAPVAVNRLDRNTTGIVISAKTLPAARILSKMIRDLSVKKHYLALVHGEIKGPQELTGLHVKDGLLNKSLIVPRGTLGRIAVTKIEPIKYDGALGATVLKIVLETGRSHQIRAHLAAIGHPIVGDVKYGGRGAERQMLHAHEVIFNGAFGVLAYLNGRGFAAPLPDDFGPFV